jgi:hypothetical protein
MREKGAETRRFLVLMDAILRLGERPAGAVMGVREVEMVDLMGVEKGNAEGGGMDLVEVKEKVKGCLRMSEEEVEDLVFLGGESKREGSTFSES